MPNKRPARKRNHLRKFERLVKKGIVKLSPKPRTRKNPAGKGKRTDPKERSALRAAMRLSERFHKDGGAHVVELSAAERKPLPKYVVVAGDLEEFSYAPKGSSQRSGYNWSHKSGDRGYGKSEGKNKPLLVVDPKTKRPAIVVNRSGMKFSGDKGFVG